MYLDFDLRPVKRLTSLLSSTLKDIKILTVHLLTVSATEV